MSNYEQISEHAEKAVGEAINIVNVCEYECDYKPHELEAIVRYGISKMKVEIEAMERLI